MKTMPTITRSMNMPRSTGDDDKADLREFGRSATIVPRIGLLCALGSSRSVHHEHPRRRDGLRDDGPVTALELFDLTGRVAVVTGASSGLGEAVARGLADAGAKVAIVARRKDRLESLATEIDGFAVACDLLEAAELDQLMPQIVTALGAPEILVNAAGTIFSHDGAEDESPEAIAQTLNLNLVAPFRLSQQVFPHMLSAGRGAIVHVSSISGLVGIPGIPQASYAASKAGLSGLTSELAVQWARHSIRVNTVAPGFFRSEITADLYDTERGSAWLKRNTPLPMQGSAGDFVGAVLWLVSDAGRYVTGQTIAVDGGWTAR
jgi:NAD(P)-dependent dehydrogenase (short-subunit alcohol dehydrogenase family)